MSKVKWSELSAAEKDRLVERREIEGLKLLARSLGMGEVSLGRRLREWRSYKREVTNQLGGRENLPAMDEVFNLLKSHPMTSDQLAHTYDRSPHTIELLLERMKERGYAIKETRDSYSINTVERPVVDARKQFPRTLADEAGQEFSFAVASDQHNGSTHAQPTNFNRFIRIATEEYGCKYFFDPGDMFAGCFGYRGQEFDLIPSVRPMSRKDAPLVAQGQVWLADRITPRIPGVKWIKLGGNHDYWHIQSSGIDAVKLLTSLRDDFVYVGYDVADIPLTDKVDLRLWHPSGGITNTISGRLQKGLEQTSYEELNRAIIENENTRLRMIVAGHVHVEVKFQRGPFLACHPGCFEGQTNYLRRKGLFPTIGGAIFKVRLTDSGNIQRVEYTFISFNEIKDDYLNWPTPPALINGLSEPDEPVVPLFYSAG